MRILMLAAALLSTTAFAQSQLDTICSSIAQIDESGMFVRSAPFFTEGFSSYRNSENGNYDIASGEGNVISSTPEKIVSLKRIGNKLWVLTPSTLTEMSTTGVVESSYTFSSRSVNTSMSLTGNVLLIARSLSGLLAFDTTSKSVKWENALGGQEFGWPVAVTSEGKIGYAAVQTADQDGFTGVLSFDLNTGKVLKKAPYHSSSGVIGIHVVAGIYKGNIILNNQGWIHLIALNQVQAGKKIKPTWVSHIVPRNGEMNSHYMMLEGDFMIEGNELKGCGKYNTLENDELMIKGKLFTVKLP